MITLNKTTTTTKNTMSKPTRAALSLATLALAGTLCLAGPVAAQVAGGTTTTGVAVVEATQIAMGWSVKKSLMGKTVYNEAGQKVGKVDDLIISPDKNLTYVIVGAGGFIGMGRHDVAVPVSEIKEVASKLVMAGATKDSVKAMPAFTYASDRSQRDEFVIAAEKDIAKGKAKVSELEKKAGTAANEAKTKMAAEVSAIKVDVTSAESKLAEMKQAVGVRWKDFEAGVSAATARLRRSVETATS